MRKTLFAILLTFSPILAQAQSTNSHFATLPVVTVPVDQFAQAFIDQFWMYWSSPNSTALPFMQSAVGDSLNFYGKPTSRADFMKAQLAFTNRWPDRQYWIQPDSEQISCDNNSNTCSVAGIVNWQDFSEVRNAASSGSAKFEFLLKWKTNTDHSIGFLITSESGSVIGSGTQPQSNFTTSPLETNDQSHNQLVTNAALQAAGCFSADDRTIQNENCNSFDEIDLTKVFHTKDKVVFEEIQADYNQSSEEPPLVNFCFVHEHRIQCQNAMLDPLPEGTNWFSYSESFLNAALIYPRPHADYPVLRAQTEVAEGMGCGGLFNFVWAYDPASGDFKLIWTRPFDCHTALVFETTGPLEGDMVAVDNDVTDQWPWQYGIEVYKFLPPDRLEKLLYVVGRAGQGGKYVSGPEDAISIDMPEILHHLNGSN